MWATKEVTTPTDPEGKAFACVCDCALKLVGMISRHGRDATSQRWDIVGGQAGMRTQGSSTHRTGRIPGPVAGHGAGNFARPVRELGPFRSHLEDDHRPVATYSHLSVPSGVIGRTIGRRTMFEPREGGIE